MDGRAKVDPEIDPFDPQRSVLSMLNMVQSTMPVSRISLDTPAEELQRMLAHSIEREGRYFKAGITCDLKDYGEHACLACPFNKSADDDHPKQHLCRIGMEQEILSTYILAQQRGERVGVSG